jgi:hypothetical protein
MELFLYTKVKEIVDEEIEILFVVNLLSASDLVL